MGILSICLKLKKSSGYCNLSSCLHKLLVGEKMTLPTAILIKKKSIVEGVLPGELNIVKVIPVYKS